MNNPNQRKTKVISFGDLTIKSSYPFIVSLFYVFRSYIFLKIRQANENIWKKNSQFFTLLMFIGESLNGFFFLISIILSRSVSDNKKNPITKFGGKSKLLAIKDKALRRQQYLIYLYIFITSLVYGINFSISNLMTCTLDNTKDLSFEMSIFNLFFIALFSFFFLKYPIYKHQFFSCALVGIGILLCIIVRLVTDNENNFSEIIINIFIYLGNNLIFSARQVFQKWLMEVKNQRPVRIIFIEAFFGICLSFIVLLICDAYGFTANTIFSLFQLMFDPSVVWLFIGYIFCCFLYGFFAIETKFYFSPTVMPVSYSFSIIFWKVLVIIEAGRDYHSMWYLIPGYLLLFFGCLLYNEILILYCCGLDKDTKKEISRRSDMTTNISIPIYTGNVEDDIVN